MSLYERVLFFCIVLVVVLSGSPVGHAAGSCPQQAHLEAAADSACCAEAALLHRAELCHHHRPHICIHLSEGDTLTSGSEQRFLADMAPTPTAGLWLGLAGAAAPLCYTSQVRAPRLARSLPLLC